MPYVKNTKKAPYKKKSYTKRRSTAPSSELFKSINRTPHVHAQPFPSKLLTRCKFAFNATSAITAQDFAVRRQVRLNSIWAPLIVGGKTVVGHQNLAAIYKRYLVTNAKISVRFFDPDTDGIRVGIRLRQSSTGDTAGLSVQELIEQPMTYMSGLSDSGKQIKNFELNVKPWTLMGLSQLEYMANTTKYSSEISASPQTDQCLMDIFAVNFKAASGNVQFMVKIIYTVQLYDRKYLESV